MTGMGLAGAGSAGAGNTAPCSRWRGEQLLHPQRLPSSHPDTARDVPHGPLHAVTPSNRAELFDFVNCRKTTNFSTLSPCSV